MRSAAQFYAAFDRAGMLVDAVWNETVTVRGDFRGEYRETLNVATTVPVFTLPKNALPDASQGDVLDIGNVRYIVAEPPQRPDHDDDMRLILRIDLS
jgi:hypothetical protein